VDASRLSKLLEDPDIGDYEVTLLINESCQTITREIEYFFNNKTKKDLSLLYFAGHEGYRQILGLRYF
jgi:hypothetical protein